MTETLNQKASQTKPNQNIFTVPLQTILMRNTGKTSSRSGVRWEEWEGVDVGGGNVRVSVIETHYIHAVTRRDVIGKRSDVL